MVLKASDYRWSSARIRRGLAYDSLLDESWPLRDLIPNWEQWLSAPDDQQFNEFIRKKTAAGRPCGAESFVRQMEELTHRQLSPQKRGRKPRTLHTGEESMLQFDSEE